MATTPDSLHLDRMVSLAQQTAHLMVKYRENARGGSLLVRTAPKGMGESSKNLVKNELTGAINTIDELHTQLWALITTERDLVEAGNVEARR